MEADRVHWQAKLAAFTGSVVTLSWFFAGWRHVNASPCLSSWALLAAGILLTVLLLGLQGYWIYFEEKSKGTLQKKIKLFDAIHARLNGDAVHRVREGDAEDND